MCARIRLLAWIGGLLATCHGCGGRSSVNGNASVGGGPPASSVLSTGGDTLESVGGSFPETGGVGTGGVMMGTGGVMMGTGGEMMGCDDPMFDCKGARPYWLMHSAWGRSPITPELAQCVDYNGDDWVDALDYLLLIDDWWAGCPEVGPLEPAGTCLLSGDVNANGCLDLEDYELIRGQIGVTAAAAPSCSDMNQSGYVDAIDLGYLLGMMETAGCPAEQLDPNIVIDGYSRTAQSCDGATLGDINLDGEVGSSDLSAVLSVLGFPATRATLCMDVDRDAAVDLADALHVLSRYLPTAQGLACRETAVELEVMVETFKGCTSDSDCQIVDARCTQVAEHCSRVVYVNQSLDPDFTSLVNTVSSCFSSGKCSTCEEEPPRAVCVMGRCQGK